MRLKDKVAIITGAASGMGASTARIFASEGAKVVLGDVLEAEGREIAQSIVSGGGDARFQKLDVASEKDWEAAVAATLAAYGTDRHPHQQRRRERQRPGPAEPGHLGPADDASTPRACSSACAR